MNFQPDDDYDFYNARLILNPEPLDTTRDVFDFNNPYAAHLEANFPYAWDEAAKFAEIRKNRRIAPSFAASEEVFMTSSLGEVKGASALIDAALDGWIDSDEADALLLGQTPPPPPKRRGPQRTHAEV